MYTVRQGTSGFRGHLYETKLLSLLLFRAKQNSKIKEFHLASNVDDIGTFDDICFKATVEGLDHPIAFFIQSKHRDNTNRVFTLDNKNDLADFFESFLKIKRKFKSDSEDLLFKGEFDETECLFILYTTAAGVPNNNNMFTNNIAEYVNDMISTGDDGSQPSFTDEDLDLLCNIALKEQIAFLAERMTDYFRCIMRDSYDCQMLMTNKFVQRFHVALAQTAIDISEIDSASPAHRVASFREDFFDTNDEFLIIFRDTLYKYMRPHLGKFLQYENGRNITYKNSDFKEKYNYWQGTYAHAHSSQSKIDEANKLAKEILTTLQFRIPAVFGNKDLPLKENKLNVLASRIIDLIEKSKPNKIVSIDTSTDARFLQLKGGIAGAVGNILIADENPKLMKFTKDRESLGKLAKQLYDDLKNKVEDLHEYKFNVQVDSFPKVLYSYSMQEENLAKEFLSKFILYTNQGSESRIEEILKSEIEGHLWNDYIKKFPSKVDAVFVSYHAEIQNWWMGPRHATFLTKENHMYDEAIRRIQPTKL